LPRCSPGTRLQTLTEVTAGISAGPAPRLVVAFRSANLAAWGSVWLTPNGVSRPKEVGVMLRRNLLVALSVIAGSATRWLSPDKAMVALSLRHRRNDIFWFTLFHELCHVLRHSKKETIVDAQTSVIAADLEEEADAFASRVLVPPQLAGHLPSLTTEAQVIEFARKLGVAPGIVVGRLQHERYIPNNQWTRLFDRYRFTDDD
jgi:hypothetical protein